MYIHINYFEISNIPYSLNNIHIVIIVEDCLFFQDKDRQLNFNMLKLIYQRAAMKYYESYLKENDINVKYLNFNEKPEYLFKYIKDAYGTNNKFFFYRSS